MVAFFLTLWRKVSGSRINRFSMITTARFWQHAATPTHSRHPPGTKCLAGCGTAAETGDVETSSIRERQGLCPTPRASARQSGSSVEGGWPFRRGRGCCSASEIPGEAEHRHPWNPPAFSRGEVHHFGSVILQI